MKTTLLIILASIFYIMACGDPGSDTVSLPNYTNGNEIFFDSTIIGDPALESETIVLTNTGDGTLEIDSAKLAVSTGEYDISGLTSQLPAKLEKNQVLEFTIKFSPVLVGKSHKNIVKLKGSESLDSFELTLTAPENEPKIRLSPKSLMFASSNTQSFTIYNTGNSILTIKKDVTISSNKFSFDENFSIPAGTKICPKDAVDTNSKCLDGDTIIPKSLAVTVNYSGTPGSSEQGNVVIFNDGEKNSDVSYVFLTAATNVCQLYVSNIDEAGSIDFGSVFISSTKSKNIALINIGGADCTLDSLAVEGTTNNIFNISYLDSYPEFTNSVVIPSRDNATSDNPNQYIFKLNFVPEGETNYDATLKLVANDPQWSDGKKDIPLLGTGSKATLPVAKCNIKINGVSTGLNSVDVEPAIDGGINPPSIITLDASESFDPNSERLSYDWDKIESPVGSVAQPRTPYAIESDYFVDLAGEHKLKLTVTNESGLTSSCEVTAFGVTSNALHVELFWNKPGDVDLHLKQPGTTDAEWGDATKDCSWKTCSSGLEWGAPGEINNPQLDRDDITGKGPENINIDTPEITTAGNYYTVGVKNFSHLNNPTATVRIYCNGGAQFEFSMNLPNADFDMSGVGIDLPSPGDFWKVADIEWTEAGCNISPINIVIDYPGAAQTR